MITSTDEALSAVDSLGVEKAEEVLRWEEYCIGDDASYEHLQALLFFREALFMRKNASKTIEE